MTKDNARAEIVEQRHREAAADSMVEIGKDWLANNIRLGRNDNHPLVQRFARFMLPAAPPASADMDDAELLADANAWYSEEQISEIRRFARHDRGCLSRKGANYDERDCDCGLSLALQFAAEPVHIPAPERPEPVENGDLVRRIRYILDAPTAKERMERRNHLTSHDLRRCLAALTLPANAGAGDSGEALLVAIEQKARDWAGNYKPHSDGFNTFVMFADWVATLGRACTCHPNERTYPCQRQFAASACQALAALSPAAGREGEI